jgi:uncharacterized protein YbaP (TraB family)
MCMYSADSKLSEKPTEKREDLKILAQGYKAVLTKRRKDWVNRPAVSLILRGGQNTQ